MDTPQQKPLFFLLSGPPGAGKSTSGMEVAPPEIKEILDFDGLRFSETGKFLRIYRGSTLEDADEAGRHYAAEYMDTKMDAALAGKQSFGVEDMIWGAQAWEGAKKIQESGFDFHLTYLGLDGADLSAKRVENRMEDGGHDYVTPEEARECYAGNLVMLDKNYQQPDLLEIYDNSGAEMKFVASFQRGEIIEATPGEAPEWVWASLPNIYEKIEAHKQQRQNQGPATARQQQEGEEQKETTKNPFAGKAAESLNPQPKTPPKNRGMRF